MIARILGCAGLALVVASPSALAKSESAPSATSIPDRPEKLPVKPLVYPAPDRTKHRHELSNGIVVYVVEDHDLPLVDVNVTARGGSCLDAKGKEGLSALTADLMRDGGAGERDASAFDEEVAFLAVNLGVGSGDRESTASMNVLKKDLDTGLDLLFDVLRRPRFQQDRLDLAKSQAGQNLERRNDDTSSIEMREWRRLAYGDHFEARQMTTTSLASITRDDIVAFHASLWNPANLVIAVSGDVTPQDVLPRLEKRMAGWAKGQVAAAPAKPSQAPPPGVFVVNKDDVNQTRVSIGILATTWNDPDAQALEVMNEILGGGAFTSRITKRVRSDEGLAYSAGSGIGFGREYPKTFRAAFQSKNMSVPRAIDITLTEMKRIATEPVSDEELQTAKNSFIEAFPQRFNSAGAKASIFVNDEIIGRPADYWSKYRDRIAAVTTADVQRVAAKLLKTDAMSILVIGKISEVMAGDKDHPKFQLGNFAGAQGVMEIPLPDPGTLVYPGPPRPWAPPAPVPAGQ